MIIEDIHHRILVLDFGSQYTQLLVRRIRELGVYCELCPWNISEEKIRQFKPCGIILSGGPDSKTKNNSPAAPNYIFNAKIPILGICYGMQTMAMQLGGQVESTNKREFGYVQVVINKKSALLYNIQDVTNSTGDTLLDVWMSHGDEVTVLPPNFINIAKSKNCSCVMMANEKKRFYGVQFHPEVTHTPQGSRILDCFVRNICGCSISWTPNSIIENIFIKMRRKIGEDKVILALSGGVDSAVTALLLYKAIGKSLICIFVDNGLLRMDEAKHIMQMFRKQFGMNIIHINASDRFFDALSGQKDPEIKRKIIGRIFIEIFEEEAKKLNNIKWLAQGTIYPDIIESAKTETGNTHLIKSHHNVGGLPKRMKLQLIEPLRHLFKDEVRKIGLELGLSNDIIYRHPFPGPGLAVRILGEVKKEYCELLRCADAIFIEELRQENLYNKISQAFVVFLPIRSIGIMGDMRKYDWVVSLRAIETNDFMTAQWVNLPYDFLIRVANRIMNEIVGISRVVYDISSKPPATIEWE